VRGGKPRLEVSADAIYPSVFRTKQGSAHMGKAIDYCTRAMGVKSLALAATLAASLVTAGAQEQYTTSPLGFTTTRSDGTYVVTGSPEFGITATGPTGTYITIPYIYGDPGFGTITIGPKGTYTMTPNVYGHPELGTTTIAPNGISCATVPKVYGHPEIGMSTTCR
jgi:hypothetical protein